MLDARPMQPGGNVERSALAARGSGSAARSRTSDRDVVAHGSVSLTRRRLLAAAPTALVLVVVAALAIWRLAYVLAGVDPDSDAYGHHIIARQILVDPSNLGIHWVWLPLFHYAQAIAILLGATLDTVRLANVAISAAVPLVLYATLRAHRRGVAWVSDEGDPLGDAVPAIAAIVCALSPISMQMGTTAQTEPLFTLLVVSIAWGLATRRPLLVAVLLTSAALLRYESWSLIPTLGVLLALLAVAKRRGWAHVPKALGLSLEANLSLRGATMIALPIAAIFGWAALRRPVDGAWFWFVGGTREFANGALGAHSSLDRGAAQLAIDLRYYVVDVAHRCIGAPLLLAPLGLLRTLRRERLSFAAIYLAILSFITLTWVMRGSLGLDRHFVVLVPFYATLIANGVASSATFAAAVVARVLHRYEHAFLAGGAARAAVVAGLACAIVLSSYERLTGWMTDWRHASEEVWPDRREVASYLGATRSSAIIFCDEPTTEVLSGVDRRRFDRHDVVDAAEPDRVRAAVARDGEAYVVSAAGRLEGVRSAMISEAIVEEFRPPGPKDGVRALRILRR